MKGDTHSSIDINYSLGVGFSDLRLRSGLMTRPRKVLISLADTPYYHITSRCVRRAFLCGVDHYSGQSYEHQLNARSLYRLPGRGGKSDVQKRTRRCRALRCVHGWIRPSGRQIDCRTDSVNSSYHRKGMGPNDTCLSKNIFEICLVPSLCKLRAG